MSTDTTGYTACPSVCITQHIHRRTKVSGCNSSAEATGSAQMQEHTACVTGLIQLCADSSCTACVTGLIQVQLPVEMMVESYHVHGMVLSSVTVCPSLESTRPPGCNSPGHLVDLVVGFTCVFAREAAGCVLYRRGPLQYNAQPHHPNGMDVSCRGQHCLQQLCIYCCHRTSSTQCFKHPISLHAG